MIVAVYRQPNLVLDQEQQTGGVMGQSAHAQPLGVPTLGSLLTYC